ncbi:MAG TPA: hypothetical protein VFG46_13165 [Chryseolinea sp.]|nr:hypothetical protein [Chryseolinea sp.]
MQRFLLIPLITFCVLSLQAQTSPARAEKKTQDPNPHARYVGKYEMNGSVIQFTLQNGRLVLVVPGAPIQELEYLGNNKFQSKVFKDGLFVFVEDNGQVVEVNTGAQQGAFKGKKIADNVELFSVAMDSILTFHKSTEHFLLRYSGVDAVIADTIAMDMEKNYTRILHDFKLEKIPLVTVRIYPDLESFHRGINFPGAPDQVLATAFGKDDIRMVSPRNAGPERWMLAYAAPHEFTHCVHLNVDYSPNNPKWLWEGVAQYEARWFFDPNELESIKKKEFPSLASLDQGMEYMLGFVVIEAIKDLWGFDTVINLIKNHGDVQKVLNIDQIKFEEKIFERIYSKYVQK